MLRRLEPLPIDRADLTRRCVGGLRLDDLSLTVAGEGIIGSADGCFRLPGAGREQEQGGKTGGHNSLQVGFHII
ncbi:hypothetical protein D3C76_1785230 [compost metagenome]